MEKTTAVVVIGGLAPDRRLSMILDKPDLVIAADAGLHHAIDLGLRVHAVVGDMDSVDRAVLVGAEVNGVDVIRSPRDKDLTDTELALRHAAERGATHITVVTGGGGRLDHQLGVIASLAHRDLAHCVVTAWWDTAHVNVLHGPAILEFPGRVGELVGLHAFGGDALGVTTNGFKWNVTNETFAAHSSRGVSNEFAEAVASIAIADGTLIVTRPEALENT
ncbi:MAG: hypothetical protein RLZZ449_232 [Actinomycetota bacterium]